MCSVLDCREFSPSYWIAAFFRVYFLPVPFPPPFFLSENWSSAFHLLVLLLLNLVPYISLWWTINYEKTPTHNPPQNQPNKKNPHNSNEKTHTKTPNPCQNWFYLLLALSVFKCDFWRFWKMHVSCLQMVPLELTVSLLQSHCLLDWRIRYGD